MQQLTDRQAAVLGFIREQISREGRAPTLREIAARFAMASTNGVRRHLAALERKGYIEREPSSARGIRLTPELREADGLPIVGRVAAGTPITAVENLEGRLSIDSLVPDGEGAYCLRVRGDSMVDAGIRDGDYVVVRERPEFEDGEIGVAIVDEECTVKRLRRVGRQIELRPANEAMAPIYTEAANVEVQGKVLGAIRPPD
jgi:repressor LexA